jgi:hypothetical protein
MLGSAGTSKRVEDAPQTGRDKDLPPYPVTGLIYSISGPDEVQVSDDVKFSLRYSGDDHIARAWSRHNL